METEIKLRFNSKEELMSILKADWFKNYCLDSGDKEPVRLTNEYFDTPDRILLEKGTSVRVRRYDDGTVTHYEHTVKFGGSVVDGLHQRYEWNVDSDSGVFDVESFRIKTLTGDDDPGKILEEALGDVKSEDLIKLCSTYCERITYTFGYGDSIMEACIDTGTVSGGGKTEPICELELELESGNVVDLKEMARIIIDETGAEPYDVSKYMRAIRLLDSSDEN